MLEKLNVTGITITETQKNGTVTTFKVDSISFEENCTAEEAIKVLEAAVNVFKTVRPTSKNKNTSDKRYHIIKTKDFPNGNGNILYYIWNRRTNSYYIKVGRTSIDIMSKEYFNESINEHKKAHRVIAEYDCNNFRL